MKCFFNFENDSEGRSTCQGRVRPGIANPFIESKLGYCRAHQERGEIRAASWGFGPREMRRNAQRSLDESYAA